MRGHSIDKNPETKYDHLNTCKASSTVNSNSIFKGLMNYLQGRDPKRARASQIVALKKLPTNSDLEFTKFFVQVSNVLNTSLTELYKSTKDNEIQ